MGETLVRQSKERASDGTMNVQNGESPAENAASMGHPRLSEMASKEYGWNQSLSRKQSKQKNLTVIAENKKKKEPKNETNGKEKKIEPKKDSKINTPTLNKVIKSLEKTKETLKRISTLTNESNPPEKQRQMHRVEVMAEILQQLCESLFPASTKAKKDKQKAKYAELEAQ